MGDIKLVNEFSAIASVESDGRVMAKFAVIGRVDDRGVVHKSEWGNDPVGRVDDSGAVYRGEYGSDQVGRVEDNGDVYIAGEFSPVARVEPPNVQWSGAAYLLLIR